MTPVTQTRDPKLHRKLSEPFESSEAADKALEAFTEELRELRAKHKIPEVVALVQVNVMYPGDLAEESSEGVAFASISFGDPLRCIPMLAEALGKAESEMSAAIAKTRKWR